MSIAKNVKWLILVIFLSHEIMALPQFDEFSFGSINVNYSRLNVNSISAGFNIGIISQNNPLLSSRGCSVSPEMYFRKSVRSFGLKATGYISHCFFIEERLNLGAYEELNTKKVWVLISPEIGITCFGVIGIFYGHNYYSDQSIRSKYDSKKFTLSLNIPIIFDHN